MGRFLKEYGKADRTKAGKMMVAVGKTTSYSGQQRLAIRVPLVRLYQEVQVRVDMCTKDPDFARSHKLKFIIILIIL